MEESLDSQRGMVGGIEIDEIDETGLEEGSSLCDSEVAASITNLNYSGPSTPNRSGKKSSSVKKRNSKQGESGVNEVIIMFCKTSYIFSCSGFVRFLHVVGIIRS